MIVIEKKQNRKKARRTKKSTKARRNARKKTRNLGAVKLAWTPLASIRQDCEKLFELAQKFSNGSSQQILPPQHKFTPSTVNPRPQPRRMKTPYLSQRTFL